MGKTIEKYLPIGQDATRWRAILNEIQMLFHEAELNRIARKEVNTCQWPMVVGCGRAAIGLVVVHGSDYRVGRHPVARGLSRLRGL
ncbi:MAG TPA: hypothetical protein VHJ19_04940 [Gammaproteobacteria bacterium]|nr:hypothetical protein [Gammaproteobacteria bacterium]